MAWYLLCAGGTGSSAPIVTIPDWVPSSQSNWGCRIKFRTGSDISSDRMICGRDDDNGIRGFKPALNGGTIVFLYAQYWNTNDWLQYAIAANTEYDLLYKVTATAFELWNNATNTLLVSKTLPNRASVGTAMGTSAVGRKSASGTTNQSPAGVRYYNVDFIDYVTPSNSRYYDANLSGGVGTQLPTVAGTNNGTQAGTWPADNSEWVFYSSGATYQLTAQGGTFSYSGSSAALNRGYKLAAQGAAYTYTGASASLTYNTATVYRMDALGASYSYAGASASLLRGFKLSASGGVYSYAGADAALTKSGPMVYRLTALGVTYVYSGGDARLTATGVIPAANPAAFVNRAYVGGRLVNNAKIGGSLTNNATVAI